VNEIETGSRPRFQKKTQTGKEGIHRKRGIEGKTVDLNDYSEIRWSQGTLGGRSFWISTSLEKKKLMAKILLAAAFSAEETVGWTAF